MNTDKHSSTKPRTTEFGTPLPRREFPFPAGGRPFFVPEGRRRRLAGGKSAPADAAPGNRAQWLRAPAGHRRNGLEVGHSLAWPWSGVGCPISMERRSETGLLSRNNSVEPILMNHRDTMNTEKTRNSQAGIDLLIGDFLELMPSLVFLCVHRVSVVLSAGSAAGTRLSIPRHPKILRCPAGAWPDRHGNRGRHSLTRACPRLISFGVPPGPETNRRRELSTHAKARAVRTETSVSLSSVRNGGEGRGEEALCNAGAARRGEAPLSPFVPHGARETERDSFRPSRRDLSHQLMSGGRIAADAAANSPRRARVLKNCRTDEGRKHRPTNRRSQSAPASPSPSVSIRVHPWFHFGS